MLPDISPDISPHLEPVDAIPPPTMAPMCTKGASPSAMRPAANTKVALTSFPIKVRSVKRPGVCTPLKYACMSLKLIDFR